jgi:putative transposase
MNANQAALSVRAMCRVLDVSPSGFYDWLDRAPSQRALDDAVLLERIRAIHAELAEQGQRVGRKRVARLMRQGAIAGVSRRRGFVVTTQREERQRPAPDLVQREFSADGQSRLWVADITYVPTWAGFVYLAVVLDVWSRRVVGWCLGETLHADLVPAALNMALEQRKAHGVIHHSDQGSQYTSLEFGRRCKEGDEGPPLDGQRRRRLRQRDGRELLRHAGVRTAEPAQLQEQGRGAHGAVRLHRGLVQPASSALGAGLPLAGAVRAAASR